MELNTASEVISFAKRLEESGAKLYEDLAERYTKDSETLLSFSRENNKNVVQIERVYYGVITDALEGGFAFKINPDEYMLETRLDEKAKYSDALNQAVEMEEKIIRFYSDAAEQSQSLLADVPRAFKMVARKRDDRKLKLVLLLHKEG